MFETIPPAQVFRSGIIERFRLSSAPSALDSKCIISDKRHNITISMLLMIRYIATHHQLSSSRFTYDSSTPKAAGLPNAEGAICSNNGHLEAITSEAEAIALYPQGRDPTCRKNPAAMAFRCRHSGARRFALSAQKGSRCRQSRHALESDRQSWERSIIELVLVLTARQP